MKACSVALLSAAIGLTGTISIQAQDNPSPTLRCEDNNNGNRRQVRHCEMREQTIAYGGQLTIDGRTNGGVAVKGWNRADVLVRMKVEGWAPNDAEARSTAGQVRVDVGGGRIAADGPKGQNESGWSVSDEVFAPRQANLDITTHNGGVAISDVKGNLQFSAVNGGVHLARVGGHVQGRTTNGGVHVELAGDRWDGDGLDVTTTNGGVNLSMPANYSARLETSTVNGGLRSDYPLAVSGEIGKRLSANIGSGGATLRVATTNGGVKIQKI